MGLFAIDEHDAVTVEIHHANKIVRTPLIQLAKLLSFAHHIVFYSFDKWHRFKPMTSATQRERPELSFGLRINPQHFEGEVALYGPCAPGSGVLIAEVLHVTMANRRQAILNTSAHA